MEASRLNHLLQTLKDKSYNRKMLYIAGPYTWPEPVENTHRAIQVATLVYELTDWVPMIPHLSLLWHMVVPKPPEFWYELDLHQMVHCSAILRLPGVSPGADNELAIARQYGLEEVFFLDMPIDVQEAWLGECQ